MGRVGLRASTLQVFHVLNAAVSGVAAARREGVPRAAGRVDRPAYVERLFREHDTHAADHSFRLYALLAYHLWMARWGRAG